MAASTKTAVFFLILFYFNYVTSFTFTLIFRPTLNYYTHHRLPNTFVSSSSIYLQSLQSSSSPLEDSSSPDATQDATQTSSESEWQARLSSPEVQFIKSELISRYVEHGHSPVQAASEVEQFLQDRTRSEPFLEMRRQAEMQEIGRFSPELGALLLGAFVLGMAGNVGPKVWEGLQM